MVMDFDKNRIKSFAIIDLTSNEDIRK